MRQRFENSGTFLNEATRLLTLLVALQKCCVGSRTYVTVTPDHQFEVSGRIKEEFENGRDYYGLHGKSIYVPKNVAQKPDSAALSWHNENCFQG